MNFYTNVNNIIIQNNLSFYSNILITLNIINDFWKIYKYNGNVLKILYFKGDNYE